MLNGTVTFSANDSTLTSSRVLVWIVRHMRSASCYATISARVLLLDVIEQDMLIRAQDASICVKNPLNLTVLFDHVCRSSPAGLERRWYRKP